jgi:hypothetical protein
MAKKKYKPDPVCYLCSMPMKEGDKLKKIRINGGNRFMPVHEKCGVNISGIRILPND